MNTDSTRETAKILKFPSGGRAAISPRRDEKLASANVSALPLPGNVICDSWYHEAAVHEELSH